MTTQGDECKSGRRNSGLATAAYEKLNPHHYKTFTDKAQLTVAPSEWTVGKS